MNTIQPFCPPRVSENNILYHDHFAHGKVESPLNAAHKAMRIVRQLLEPLLGSGRPRSKWNHTKSDNPVVAVCGEGDAPHAISFIRKPRKRRSGFC